MRRLNKSVSYPENIIVELLDNASVRVSDDMKDGYYHILGQLDERRREMIILRYQDRLTYEQIAKRYGVSKGRTRDIIWRTLRIMRHPTRVNYVKFGKYYLDMLRTEESERRLRYEDIYKNKVLGVSLSDLEEISVRTYNRLLRKGFNTLNDVQRFIEETGPDWYRQIADMGIKAKIETEQAIRLYGLDDPRFEQGNREQSPSKLKG